MSRRDEGHQDTGCFLHWIGGGGRVRQKVFLNEGRGTGIMVNLTREAFFSEGIGIDEEGIVPSELVEFFAKLCFIFSHLVLLNLLIRVLIALPNRDRACALNWLPFLPKLGLAHIRVVVSHF